jgi:hypothetical protein
VAMVQQNEARFQRANDGDLEGPVQLSAHAMLVAGLPDTIAEQAFGIHRRTPATSSYIWWRFRPPAAVV